MRVARKAQVQRRGYGSVGREGGVSMVIFVSSGRRLLQFEFVKVTLPYLLKPESKHY